MAGNVVPNAEPGAEALRGGIKDTLVVPAGWGRGGERNDALLFAGPDALEQAKVRGEVDTEIRAALEAAGIRIKESHSGRAEQSNEVSALAAIDPALERRLYAALPEITADVQRIDEQDLYTFRTQPQLKYPVVAYFEGFAGGEGKFLLDTPEQFDKLQRLMGMVDSSWSRLITIKRFVESPSNRYTSYRVLADPNGKIIAAALLCSATVKGGEEQMQTDGELEQPYSIRTLSQVFDHFTTPESPYYLGGRRFTSNIHGGGGCVPLNPTPDSRQITAEERALLAAHGNHDQMVPPELVRAVSSIMEFLGSNAGLATGLDFIQGPDGFYWLEPNGGPGVQTVNEVYNHGAVGVGPSEALRQGYRTLLQKSLTAVFGVDLTSL